MIINNRFILDNDIKGTLCWFWNNNEVNKKIGILADIYVDEECPEQTTFYELNGGLFKHCEPADEKDITFYADKDCSTRGLRKAKKALIEAIEENLQEQMNYYEENSDDYINYVEAALDDKVHVSCFQDEKILKLARKLVAEM